MDIETLNKIQAFLENSGANSNEFILEALEHELERRKTKDVLNIVLDEFRKKVDERMCPDQKVCKININIAFQNNNVTINVPKFSTWVRENVDYDNYQSNGNKRIILVMESPHANEFDGNCKNNKKNGIQVPAPA